MAVIEIKAKSILRKHKRVDSWFVSRYGMNLYRGCLHDCAYCDGRAERYNVQGEFGKDITVKTNALEILDRELDPTNKRVPLKRGYIMVGGGVGDSYQSVEKRYELTRGALELALKYEYPVHILTKSTLVKRDIDLIQQIHQKAGALVSISFSSVDEKISNILEPHVPPPNERLQVLSEMKKAGIPCGMFLMPAIPYISDSPEYFEEAVKASRNVGVTYIIFSGMTLKQGRQEDRFLSVIKMNFPELIQRYQWLYQQSGKWGNPREDYIIPIQQSFDKIARRYRMPQRIPSGLFKRQMDDNDRVVVILEQMDYLLKTKGEKSPFGYAAYVISQLKEPLSQFSGDLKQLKGINSVTEGIIREVISTGTAAHYKHLMTQQ